VQNADGCCPQPELTKREALWLWLGETVQCKWIMLLGLAEMITEGTNVHGQLVDRIIHDKAVDSSHPSLNVINNDAIVNNVHWSLVLYNG